MSTLHTPSYQRFVALLVEARKVAGFTQAQLADKLEKPQSFVSKYERLERRLDVIEFLEVTEAIGCDPILIMKAMIA